MITASSDVAFSAKVKEIQAARGSRMSYARIEAHGGFHTEINADLQAFLAQVDTAYLATANALGQPYAQHRGGPKGFIQVLDRHTLAFADYTGNRQYISTGNLAENDKAFLFLMDYAQRRRVKIWGNASCSNDDPELIGRLIPAGYRARPEQAILFKITAWDANCPQHIPQKFSAVDVMDTIRTLEAKIAALEAENMALKRC
jgi:uncharacterized protein